MLVRLWFPAAADRPTVKPLSALFGALRQHYGVMHDAYLVAVPVVHSTHARGMQVGCFTAFPLDALVCSNDNCPCPAVG